MGGSEAVAETVVADQLQSAGMIGSGSGEEASLLVEVGGQKPVQVSRGAVQCVRGEQQVSGNAQQAWRKPNAGRFVCFHGE